jgi:hypothetical protein
VWRKDADLHDRPIRFWCAIAQCREAKPDRLLPQQPLRLFLPIRNALPLLDPGLPWLFFPKSIGASLLFISLRYLTPASSTRGDPVPRDRQTLTMETSWLHLASAARTNHPHTRHARFTSNGQHPSKCLFETRHQGFREHEHDLNTLGLAGLYP